MIAFEKWEGLGNDFVVVEAEPTPAEILRMCDRRLGIGADGVLVATRARGASPARMVVYNADGSRPEMCGNGLRCVAAWLAGAGASAELVVATDAGERACNVAWIDGGAHVDVDMGVATFGAPLAIELRGERRAFAFASVGNPHAVTFEPVDPALHEALGRATERAVAGGINVELARANEGRFEVVVWERGVGFTQACGTGACAVAAVACRMGLAKFDEPTEVRLPGGPLTIVVASSSISDRTGAIRMRGPARRTFCGVWG